MSLKEPEKKLETQNELFRIGVREVFDEVESFGLYSIVRDSDSTVEKTLAMLEEHFGLRE
jgi:hypothetical protein